MHILWYDSPHLCVFVPTTHSPCEARSCPSRRQTKHTNRLQWIHSMFDCWTYRTVPRGSQLCTQTNCTTIKAIFLDIHRNTHILLMAVRVKPYVRPSLDCPLLLYCQYFSSNRWQSRTTHDYQRFSNRLHPIFHIYLDFPSGKLWIVSSVNLFISCCSNWCEGA